MDGKICREAIERFENKKHFRILLFGASNTERYAPFMHWGDVLEVGLRSKYSRKFHLINSGYGGSNTREALDRFELFVEDFQPDVVIITFGGNDSINRPERFIPEDEFTGNLEQIIRRIRSWGGIPILQTYYKPDLAALDPVYAKTFVRYMEVVREIAGRMEVFLVDQYKAFEKLPPNTLKYKLLLNDMHVNEYGNMLMGIILLKHLQILPKNIQHAEKLLPAVQLYNKFITEDITC